MISARVLVWVGFLTGAGISIWGNVAASQNSVGAKLAGAFWPIGLLIAIEILTRVDWPDSPWWRAAGYGGLTPVAAVTAMISYTHLSALLDRYGYSTTNAHAGPLAIDGLMVLCSAGLLAIAQTEAAARDKAAAAELRKVEAAERAAAAQAALDAQPAPRPATRKAPTAPTVEQKPRKGGRPRTALDDVHMAYADRIATELARQIDQGIPGRGWNKDSFATVWRESGRSLSGRPLIETWRIIRDRKPEHGQIKIGHLG